MIRVARPTAPPRRSALAKPATPARTPIVSALDEADFVELSQDAMALGRRRDDADG